MVCVCGKIDEVVRGHRHFCHFHLDFVVATRDNVFNQSDIVFVFNTPFFHIAFNISQREDYCNSFYFLAPIFSLEQNCLFAHLLFVFYLFNFVVNSMNRIVCQEIHLFVLQHASLVL